MIRQKGAISLVVTSLLMVVSLALSVASYRSIFFQIKRAQNEVKSRQEHWIAEGGLECLYAQAQTTGIPSVPGNCNLESGLNITVTNDGAGKYRVDSKYSHARITKHLQYGGNLGTGAIQASSDLYFHGGVTVSTPDPGKYTNDGWECVAVRYKSRFRPGETVNNQGVIHGLSPSENFNSHNKDCASEHFSQNMVSQDKEDFTRDPDVSPFEDFFGVSAEKHEEVRKNGKFHTVNGGVVPGKPRRLENCGEQLTNLIKSGEKHIWVEGGCEIKTSEYKALVQATQEADGVTIVVHDGILSLMGKSADATKSDRFKGVLFHFNHNYTPTKSDWNGLDAKGELYHNNPAITDSSYTEIAAYYQHGSFSFSGAQYFDTPGQSSIFNTSTNFSFDGDVVKKARQAHRKPTWIAGSWHDF
ncbi:hypothetical protein DI392_05220 [Vibrio albus]|uniref:Uncharacterized protein n=1 Tax=Vibrio albus TaxID=2200953 RepID=A0A2U3BCI7_9VIBR|nr:hypothetical protein [Vibrio albus]PWI34511.1 hypothetical protein DI392_05220 [Vibrio albus]